MPLDRRAATRLRSQGARGFALMIARMKAVRFTARSVPFVFALITIAAYGLMLPLTGFYWDDWPFAWIARFLGPSEFIPAFRGFRPFLGPIFFLTTSLLPADPILWQTFALLVRFLAGLAAWSTFDQIWPRGRRLTLSASLLFLLFPGYSQHWVAFTHINQEWVSLIAYLLSFGLSVRAIRDPRISLATSAAALLLQCVALLPTEYFIGLELLRVFFFWAVFSETVDGWGARLRAGLKAWWPYMLVWLINAGWLAYYYGSGLYVSYDLTTATGVPAPREFILVFGDALVKAGIYVWLQVLPLVSGSLSTPTGMATIAMIGMAFLLLAFYLTRWDEQSAHTPTKQSRGRALHTRGDRGANVNYARAALLTGAIGILLGRIPSFAAGLPLTLQSSFDRLTIPMMLGASLFVAGLFELLIPRLRARMILLAAVLGLGVGQQFFNANIFRRDWQRQQEIYWQFAWRMPSLKPGTAILTQQMPLDYETDLAMTAAVNWMFAADVEPPDLPYAVVYTEKRLGGDALPELEPGIPMELPLRTMKFKGSTSQAIVVYVPASGCLRVFDPAFDDAETYSRFPESLTAAIPLSDPSRILTHAISQDLPTPPFSRAPVGGWCYLYEKAELSRQVRDWENIVDLHTQAMDEGLSPSDPFEWLPFIEAEALTGDIPWAVRITRRTLQDEPRLEPGLCALWKRVHLTAPQGSPVPSPDMLAEIGCDG